MNYGVGGLNESDAICVRVGVMSSVNEETWEG